MIQNISARKFKQFDPVEVERELSKVVAYPWTEHPGQRYHDHAWFCMCLYSAGGESDGVLTKDGSFDATVIFQETEAFSPFIDAIACTKKRIRIMKLLAHSRIGIHTDDDPEYYKDTVKIHVPVRTNPRVVFTVGDAVFHMAPGECWYINTDMPHGVVNEGDTDRVHLIMDCVVNPELERMILTGQGPG